MKMKKPAGRVYITDPLQSMAPSPATAPSTPAATVSAKETEASPAAPEVERQEEARVEVHPEPDSQENPVDSGSAPPDANMAEASAKDAMGSASTEAENPSVAPEGTSSLGSMAAKVVGDVPDDAPEDEDAKLVHLLEAHKIRMASEGGFAPQPPQTPLIDAFYHKMVAGLQKLKADKLVSIHLLAPEREAGFPLSVYPSLCSFP